MADGFVRDRIVVAAPVRTPSGNLVTAQPVAAPAENIAARLRNGAGGSAGGR